MTPVMPLTETYALRGLAARGRAYGPVRLWGSLAFIVGTFGAGFAADVLPARHLIWLIVAASVMAALAALTMLAPLSTGAPRRGHRPAPRKNLLRDKAFIAVVAAASLDPGKPRGVLRLLGAGMARRRARRHGDRGAVGLGRDRGDRAVRAVGAAAGFLHAERDADDRRRRRRVALDGDGLRSAGGGACRSCNCCTGCRSAPPISAR